MVLLKQKTMKTNILIDYYIFSIGNNIKDCIDFYNKEYKKDGWILDLENQKCFKEFDFPMWLNVGDDILLDGMWVVKSKWVDLNNNLLEYQIEPN